MKRGERDVTTSERGEKENVIKTNSSAAGEFLTLKWSQKNRDSTIGIKRTNE